MAADRSSNSSQIEKAPSTTTIAPSSTPNTGTAGFTVPAPIAPSQPPVWVMKFCALPAALWLMAVAIQSLESIRIWARAGPTAEKIAAIGRYTNAERIACMASTRTIDWATETSRTGSAITTASASITRYCEPNQFALATLGLVVPLISPPTFCRNQLPALDTAAVKLRSALSPAADTMPVAAPVRALPTERPAPAPTWQICRAIGVWTCWHLSVCCAFCCGAVVVAGVVVVGAACATAAGAMTRTDATARPTTSKSQRPQGRSGTWSIVVLLELLDLVDEVRGRGWGIAVGDRDRPVRDGCTGLLPVLAGPFELHRRHAPCLLWRQARVLVAAHARLPDRDAGPGAIVKVEAVAHGDGLEDHLLRVDLRERLVRVLDPEARCRDDLGLVLHVTRDAVAGLRRRDRVDGRPASRRGCAGPPERGAPTRSSGRSAARRRTAARRARACRTGRARLLKRGAAAREARRSREPGSAHVPPTAFTFPSNGACRRGATVRDRGP